jgi:small-conductance mechanosensitive channel
MEWNQSKLYTSINGTRGTQPTNLFKLRNIFRTSFMGSDSELNNRKNFKTDETASIEFPPPPSHHNTVHSYTVPNEETVTATGQPTSATEPANGNNQNFDDEIDDDSVSGSFMERLMKFLVKATPFARAIRIILWGCLLGVIGAALYHFDPALSFLSITSIPAHINCIAFALMGYGILLSLLHFCVVFAHRQPYLYQSNILHWITEFEEYLAAGIWVTFLLGILANVTKPTTEAEIASNFDFFLKIYLLAGIEPKTHVRLCCLALVVLVLSAAKRHFMHKLAIQFNYSNYCDRVEESLFIEAVLQSLNKARSAYKFRKRWKLFLTDSKSPNKKSTATVQMGDFAVDSTPATTINLKEFSSKRESEPVKSNSGNSANYNSNGSPNFIEIVSSPVKPSSPISPTQNQQPASTTQSASSGDKKRQFEEFSRLCNRTATQFDSLSGADIRVEIHRESRRIGAQLFKWLCHPQRGDIGAADLEPFIDNPEDLVRFMAILKRSQKVPVHLQTASFSEGDLRRAIDAALLERYGLAKSMETIEMALGKIDGILNVLLLILVASLVERLFFTSSGPSPLFGIGTIFFSASFFFKDVAKSTFESIIFLLIIHPFDIGDRVFIKLDTTDNKAGGDCTDNLLVVEMNLMSTVFERWDGVKIYVPNSVLSTKPIYNIRRSGPTTDLLRMSFAHATRIDQLENLRLRLQSFLRQNRQDFTEFHRINIDALENCNRMNVTILIQHASNWQDLELQMARRTKILSFLKNSIEDLGIHYLPPVQRVELLSDQHQQKYLV